MNLLVNGVKMSYRIMDQAHEDAAPLLLIHGFPLTGELWDQVAGPLSRDGRIIIPDLRGFGSSELTSDDSGAVPPMSIAQYADDLFMLLEAIGERRPCVVAGMSMGGYIALEFHRRYTSRVRALALIDTRAAADSPEKKVDRFVTAERVLSDGVPAVRQVASGMAEKLFSSAADRALREHWREIMSRTRPESMAAALLAMAARNDYTATLRSIYCPSLIVVGEDDAITPVADAHILEREIPISELRVIPAAGHMTPVEQPPMLVDAVRSFLRDYAIVPAVREAPGDLQRV